MSQNRDWQSLFAQTQGVAQSLWRYDECWDPTGILRPSWKKFIDEAQAYAPEPLEVSRRLEQTIAWRHVHFRRYKCENKSERPWPLDALPVLVEAGEWRFIERAVLQRLKLLNAMMTDLYGPQRLIREGLVPPALVYGQSEFIWGLKGVQPSGGQHLLMYAVDLARAADGRWWVMSDRAGAPSGLGYMLENRQIMNLAYDGLPDRTGVRNVEASVRQWFGALLTSLEKAFTEEPFVVLLSPGSAHETYHEQAFLASFLGIPLVEGDDLLVREQTLFMRAEQGLLRVHGLIRRLDSIYCDPLELRSDSALGVPGLSQVIRSGQVRMANAPGSGILEAPGLLAFLPAIARHLLGEELLLPAVATWWCGEPTARRYVLQHLQQLNLSPAFTHQRMDLIQTHMWSERKLRLWKHKIQSLPQAYVGQELVSLSTTPVFDPSDGGGIQNRPMGLRVFAWANEDNMQVIPGGLVRVAPDCAEQVISMQRGGRPKDVWVQIDAEEKSTELYVLVSRRQPRKASRLEHVFWLGRYLERWQIGDELDQDADGEAEFGNSASDEWSKKTWNLKKCYLQAAGIAVESLSTSAVALQWMARMGQYREQIRWQLHRLAGSVPRPWQAPEETKDQSFDRLWMRQRCASEGDEWEEGWLRNCFQLGRAVEQLFHDVFLRECLYAGDSLQHVPSEQHTCSDLEQLVDSIYAIMSFWPDMALIWSQLLSSCNASQSNDLILRQHALDITDILNERLFWFLPESNWRIRS